MCTIMVLFHESGTSRFVDDLIFYSALLLVFVYEMMISTYECAHNRQIRKEGVSGGGYN